MKELFQVSFRCTKLKCGVIWAFVVTSATGPRCERHLGSAACRVLCEEPSRKGAFCAVGAVLASRSQRFHTEHKYKLKPVKSELKGSEYVQHLDLFYCFTIVLFSLGILQALYFSLILSRCQFLFRLKCYEIVYCNCKLKLCTFKAGFKNVYSLYIK